MANRLRAILSRTLPASPLSHPFSQTALLLLDYQNVTVNFLPAAQKSLILSNAQNLRDWARTHDVLIIHCLVDLSRPPAPTAKMSLRWPMWEKMLAGDPSGAEEHPALDVKTSSNTTNELSVTRPAGIVSATKSDRLLELLEGNGITSLVLAGISTSGCVLSTAKAAADAGFVVTAVEDCCGEPEEGLHELICGKLLERSVNVVGSGEWLGAWEG